MAFRIATMSLRVNRIERDQAQIPCVEGLLKERDNEHIAERNARAKEVREREIRSCNSCKARSAKRGLVQTSHWKV